MLSVGNKIGAKADIPPRSYIMYDLVKKKTKNTQNPKGPKSELKDRSDGVMFMVSSIKWVKS